MFDLKPLSKDAVGRALEKAERYRLLNEPAEAESICEDVLKVDPGNQQAEITLLLALTDQFEEALGEKAAEALQVAERLRDGYPRAYYAGIVSERRAKALRKRGSIGASQAAYGSFLDAMRWFEKAEALRPAGNDDALLRWNACARILDRNPSLTAPPADSPELPLE